MTSFSSGPARETPPPPSPPARPGAPGAAYLFGGAAVILAAALLIAMWRGTVGAPAPAAGSSAQASPAAAASPPPPAADSAVLVPAAIPKRGPKAAADAIVGAPRGAPAIAPEASARTPLERAAIEPRIEELSVGSAPARASSFDAVYHTRRFAKFSVSPDQARLYVDGRYVGIADDWDDHGGGRTLELSREGSHRVRLELPGYRTLNLEIVAGAGARDETVDIGDELKRESKAVYPKIPKVNDRTVGPVEFAVDPPDAQLSEGGRILGTVSSFGPDSPLRLSGPMVHELVISAPGRKPKTVRVLVASNADRERAKVKVELKKE